MDEELDYSADPALDATFILIAELHRSGLLLPANLASMARRFELGGHTELAERLRMIPLANAIDTPENNRAALALVDGANEPD